jgi:hypothetical protein
MHQVFDRSAPIDTRVDVGEVVGAEIGLERLGGLVEADAGRGHDGFQKR